MSQPADSDARGRLAHAVTTSGPVSFLNPTTQYIRLQQAGRHVHRHAAQGEDERPGGPNGDGRPRVTGRSHATPPVYHVWRSRDNRKGRHALVLTRRFIDSRRTRRMQEETDRGKTDDGLGQEEAKATADSDADSTTTEPPRPTNSLREIGRGIVKMFVRFPLWDVSYDVALFFTLGSAIWVINAFFVWLPLQVPSSAFHNETAWGGSITALVGGSVFFVGASLGMLEALNENRADCFGWALEEALGSRTDLLIRRLHEPGACLHHHAERRRLFWREQPSPGKSRHGALADDDVSSAEADRQDVVRGVPAGEEEDDDGEESVQPCRGNDKRRVARQLPARPPRRWSWCPSWDELRTHYMWEMGFWACLIQLLAATVFWIACVTGLPPIIDNMSVPLTNGIYWLPQVVGGTGFVISSVVFMLETQTAWYRPAPGLLGWHIGGWNLVGSIGFTLCGAFGFAAEHSNMNYAANMSTYIGSWAFLIGSVIQLYESLDKYPVSIEDSVPEKTVGET